MNMEHVDENQNELLLKQTQEDYHYQKNLDFKQQNNRRFLGLLCALVSAFFYSLHSLNLNSVKEISPVQFGFIGSAGLLIVSSVILVFQRRSPWPQDKHFQLFLRCIFGSVAFISANTAVRYLPIGDASVIMFSSPILVTIFAHFILKEPFTIFHLLLNLITLIGITLIARPPFLFTGHTYDSRDAIIGLLFALSHTFFASGVYISMRALANIHYSVVIFHFSIVGAVSCGVLSLYLGTFTFVVTKTCQAFVFTAPILHISGQILLTKSLQLEDAGPVSMIRCSDVVFAFIWQYLFLGLAPTLLSVGGAVLVLGSVILMGFRKVVEGSAENSKIAKNCWCLTI